MLIGKCSNDSIEGSQSYALEVNKMKIKLCSLNNSRKFTTHLRLKMKYNREIRSSTVRNNEKFP